MRNPLLPTLLLALATPFTAIAEDAPPSEPVEKAAPAASGEQLPSGAG